MQTEITLNDILLEIRFIKTNMVTKEEAKNFATKEDLQILANEVHQNTEDIKNLTVEVRKNTEDIKNLTVEVRKNTEDIKNLTVEVRKNTEDIRNLTIEVQKHTKDIRKMRKEISEIKFVMNGLASDIGMLDNRTRSLVVYGK